MSEKRYFLGIDHGHPDGGKSVAILVEADGEKIGVLQEFSLDRSLRDIAQIAPLPDGVLEFSKKEVFSIPLKQAVLDEKALAKMMQRWTLDDEINNAPPRKTWPQPWRKKR